MTKTGIDAGQLESLEQDAQQCVAALLDIVSRTNNAAAYITALSAQNLEAYQMCVESTGDNVNKSVLAANKYIEKCREINEVFRGVEPLYERIQEIKKLLDIYEKLVAQALRQR
eukprot:CAMPEP_0119133440 /NCGR_PEP_ID=MMETSP1310-20130426/13375_1 /TAXON_ID=464262 /ORGANISM="Genus nov. species nov., Strain RCC2339" /LENGTH=113 /DNA_ID=CAMNT_0007124131 /DNA_START=170 /DNA_END=511 /DNA_ORIENTATION=-